jgi:hypothetical protein
MSDTPAYLAPTHPGRLEYLVRDGIWRSERTVRGRIGDLARLLPNANRWVELYADGVQWPIGSTSRVYDELHPRWTWDCRYSEQWRAQR